MSAAWCMICVMKYLTDMKTDAVYTDNGSRNPLFEALPDLLSKEELFDRIRSCPESRSAMQRKEKLQSELMYQLSSMFIPMDYMIYMNIYIAQFSQVI